MPNLGTQTHAHTPRVRNGEPQPAAVQTPEPASAKRDLTSWWRQFSKRPPKKEDEKGEISLSLPAWLRLLGLGVLSSSGVPDKAEFLSDRTCACDVPANHYSSYALTDLYCYTQKPSLEFSVYPSSKAYLMQTLLSRCSTSTERATYTAMSLL
jgi:hypothetical protein